MVLLLIWKATDFLKNFIWLSIWDLLVMAKIFPKGFNRVITRYKVKTLIWKYLGMFLIITSEQHCGIFYIKLQ